MKYIFFSFLLFSFSVISQTLPTIDGNFCEPLVWGAPTGIGTDVCNDTPTNTADFKNGWFINSGGNVYVAIERCATGSGTSQYTMRFDINCDNAVDAAIYVNWDAIGSNCSSAEDLILLDTNGNTTVIGQAFQGSPSCPTGTNCPDAGKFLEFKFNTQAVIDQLIAWGTINPCLCTCNSFKFLDYVSLAGGSLSSSPKDAFTTNTFTLNQKINDCPVANFGVSGSPECIGQQGLFDASSTIDAYPLTENLTYSWNFGDGTTATGQTALKTFTTAGTYNVVLTVKDKYLCTNTKTTTIVVRPLPVIVCPTSRTEVSCQTQAAINSKFASWLATASASGGINGVLTNNNSGAPSACGGSKTVIFSYTNTCQPLITTCSATFTVNADVTPPVITGTPAAVTVSCAALVPESSISPVTATDNCAGTVTITVADVTTAGTCANNFTVTRTWTATDICGNTSTSTQLITVNDIIKPVITGTPAALTVSCAALVPAALPTSVIATDNCSGAVTVTVADVNSSVICANKFTITRTWTATDICGNTSTSTQLIIVNDIIKPVITGTPAALTVSCAALVPAALPTSVIATDNCSGAVTVTVADVNSSVICANKFTITRTWTATDICGNTSTSTQLITVNDITAPVIAALPATSTINCPATPDFAVATAVDACGSAFTLTSADVTTNGACAGSYSVTRTWTATDVCGNSSTASQTINVQDIIAPVIAALPATSTINCPATPDFAVATAVDACGSVFTLTSADVTTNGACAGSNSVTRTWTATDACGNSSTASQTINVQDIIAPVIACPSSSQFRNLAVGESIYTTVGTEFDYTSLSDNCGTATATNNLNGLSTLDGYPFNSRSTTVTWTATDECGNIAECSFVVTVNLSPIATNNTSLANAEGAVTQQVITEDDGAGVDSDPDGALVASSIDLDPLTAGQQTSLVVAGEGTWTVDGAGNVTFTPEVTFNDDPTGITYTIKDNDGNVSNTATIAVDYVPVATADASTGNTTNNPVTVNVLTNDLTGDVVDPTTVQIVGTANSGDPLVVASEGTWTVNATTGAITFTPEAGFTANPTDITYTVEDGEGNVSAPAIVNIEYAVQAPIADNESSAANVSGVNVTQNIITGDLLGDGSQADPADMTVALIAPVGVSVAGNVIIVPGQGTWTYNPAMGELTFDPETGFTTDPTPITYTITEIVTGLISNIATVAVTYEVKPLPINLISFSGNQFDDSIVLNWKTANEKDFSHFEVHRSSDSKEFGYIATFEGKKSGFYNLVDKNPNMGINYYRLKMVDLDGKFALSNIISINFEEDRNFVIVENPANNGEFNLSTNMINPKFALLTNLGVSVDIKVNNAGNQYLIKAINAHGGLYYINIVSNGKLVTKKVVIP